MVETPPPANRSFTSGILRISTTLALSLSRIGCGGALGANSAVPFDAFVSPAPASFSVGQSGLSDDRLAVVMANTRIWPLDTCGATEELAKTATGKSPATNAV